LRSRYLSELTTPEVEEYLSRGGGTALLPVGCVEMHGPHQPIGTDTLIAQAFALEVAKAGDGLVLPEIHYTWAGSTDGFAGTISVEPELVQKTVEAVAVKVFRMGFLRLVVVSIHALNECPLVLTVRRFYEEYHKPALYVTPYKPFTEGALALFAGEYGRSKEASVVLAALHLLGKPTLYSEEEMRYDDESPLGNRSKRAINPFGVVGYFMSDPRQHACPSRYVSLERGLEFMRFQVEAFLPVLDHLDGYAEYTEMQANQGWWA